MALTQHGQISQAIGDAGELVGDLPAKVGIRCVGAGALLVAVGEQQHVVRAAVGLGVVGDELADGLGGALHGVGERGEAVGAQLLVAGVVLYAVHPRQHIPAAGGAGVHQAIGGAAAVGAAVVVAVENTAIGAAVLGAHLVLGLPKARVAGLELAVTHQPKLGVGAVLDDAREGGLGVEQPAAELAGGVGVRVGVAAVAVARVFAGVVPEHGARGVENHQHARGGLRPAGGADQRREENQVDACHRGPASVIYKGEGAP